MTREQYDFRLNWLGITNQQVIDLLNKRGRHVTKSRVSECFQPTFVGVAWASSLRVDLDITTRALIEERRAAIMERIRAAGTIQGDFDVCLPVDDGYPIISGDTVLGRYVPDAQD